MRRPLEPSPHPHQQAVADRAVVPRACCSVSNACCNVPHVAIHAPPPPFLWGLAVAGRRLLPVFYALPLQVFFDCLLRFTQTYAIGPAPCTSDSDSDSDPIRRVLLAAARKRAETAVRGGGDAGETAGGPGAAGGGGKGGQGGHGERWPRFWMWDTSIRKGQTGWGL
eukprot:364989-Chlamydomonas_euryale.AAC.9